MNKKSFASLMLKKIENIQDLILEQVLSLSQDIVKLDEEGVEAVKHRIYYVSKLIDILNKLIKNVKEADNMRGIWEERAERRLRSDDNPDFWIQNGEQFIEFCRKEVDKVKNTIAKDDKLDEKAEEDCDAEIVLENNLPLGYEAAKKYYKLDKFGNPQRNHRKDTSKIRNLQDDCP